MGDPFGLLAGPSPSRHSDPDVLGRQAYLGSRARRLDGLSMPTWADLPEAEREHWRQRAVEAK